MNKILLLLPILLLTGCTQEKFVTLKYDSLKQCEPTPWVGTSAKNISEQLINYYNNYNITVYNPSMQITELITCAACGCPSSMYYILEVKENDVDKMIELGWKLN